MRKEMTFEELDSQHVELLPTRETLGFFNHSYVAASNSSLALNVGTILSQANSAAVQTIVTNQG